MTRNQSKLPTTEKEATSDSQSNDTTQPDTASGSTTSLGDTCGVCDSTLAISVDTYRRFTFPSEYDYVCRDCAPDINTHTAADMTDGELVAAIMSDSHGYASPQHAQRHVDNFRAGEDEAYCERATSCFNRDMDALIESARRHWMHLTGEKQDKIKAFAEQWDSIDDPATSMTVSATYPLAFP